MKPLISIKFDENAHGVYYSGQNVSGRVEVSFAQAKKVRGILLDITGYASAHFTARSNNAGRKRRKAHYTAKEEYISTKEYLYGSANETPTELQPGKYSYKFSCQLPNSVPSSFEGFYGHIRYVAKVVLDRPWKFDQKFMQGFTVLKAVDLNFESPSIRNPATLTSSRQAVWGGIFKASTFNMKVTVPQTGYVSGQQIPISVEIDNDSNMPATKVRFFLRQLISYFADTPHVNSKIDIVFVARVKTFILVAPKSMVRVEEKLTIPPLPPTTAQYSQVIRVNYDLNVDVVALGCKPKPSVNIPITIGTVPLVGIQEYQQASLTTPQHIVPLQPIPSTSSSNTQHYNDPAANIAPPSYEQAINMRSAQLDVGEENTIERSEFIPRYPVYSSIPVVVESAPEVSEKEKYIPI